MDIATIIDTPNIALGGSLEHCKGEPYGAGLEFRHDIVN
jgi:hypothetical protein